VIIVDIDEKSLEQFGQYPWKRTILASILKKLADAGVGIVGLDIMFPETDRTSPHRFAEEFGLDVTKFDNYDEVFGSIVGSTPTVLGYTFNLEATKFIFRDTPDIPAMIIEQGLTENNDFMIHSEDIILNIPTIQDQAYSSGFFNSTPDPSGIIRSVPLVIKYDDEVFTSLALEMVRLAKGIEEINIEYDENGVVGITLGDQFIPTDRYGRLFLNYRGPGRTFKYISAADIYNGDFNKSEIENSFVLVGTSAAGLFDIRSTPLDSVYPGVEVHATAIDNLLAGDFLYKPNWLDGFNVVVILGIVFIVSLLFNIIPANFVLGLFPIFAFGIFKGIEYMLFHEGIMVSSLFPFLALFISTFILTIINLFIEQKQKKLIKGKFAAKVSPAVMEDLINSGGQDVMVGKTKEITVMFSDVRNFTNISESMPNAKTLIEFLNEYMDPMTEIIMKHEGTIDKFIGDAIMAYWNAPGDVPDHANKAVIATLEQLHKLDELNAKIKQDPRFEAVCKMSAKNGVEPIEIGIGLNTGVAIAGEMGSSQRSDYTVIGDPVNLGARLQSLCKYYNSKFNISNFTKEKLKGKYIYRFLDLVTVKGKSEPIEIWQIIDYNRDESMHKLYKVSRARLDEELEYYHKAIDLYKASKFEEALKIFKEINEWEDKTNKNIYIKLFKNIPHIDLEMLFPNTEVKMTLFDKAKLGVVGGGGTVGGGTTLVAKLSVAAIEPLSAMMAIGAFGGILWRQVKEVFSRRTHYTAKLSQKLYFHNLDNNAGALSYILSMAQDEESKEALLVYIFLSHYKEGMSLKKLDMTIEKFVKEVYGIDIDFEVNDGIDKLRKLGFIVEDNNILSVIDIDKAIDILT